MHKYLLTIVAFVQSFFCLTAAWAIGADAASKQSPEIRLETLTKEVLAGLVDLERTIIGYRLRADRINRNIIPRYFISQEADVSLINAAFITSFAESEKHLSSPQLINKSVLENGAVCGIVGTCIGTAGSALELGIDCYQAHTLNKDGFSRKEMYARIKKLSNNIDNLLSMRRAMVKSIDITSMSSVCIQAQEVENKLLADIRDLSVLEYDQFQAELSGRQAFFKSLHFLDTARHATGAASWILALRSLQKGNLATGAAGGIVGITAGTLTMLSPVVSRMIGAMASSGIHYPLCLQHHERKGIALLSSHLNELDALRRGCEDQSGLPGPLKRLAFYQSHSKIFLDQTEVNAKAVSASNRTATENILVGLANGGCIVGANTLFTISDYRFSHNLNQANRLYAAGNLVAVPGFSLAVLDNARILAQYYVRNHRLCKTSTLPRQLLEKRLAELNQMETTLNSL